LPSANPILHLRKRLTVKADDRSSSLINFIDGRRVVMGLPSLPKNKMTGEGKETKTKYDEFGKFYECQGCLTDHDTLKQANDCCGRLVMPDLDMSAGRQPHKPITPKQEAWLSRPMPHSIFGKDKVL
jgi:hypothetical protein